MPVPVFCRDCAHVQLNTSYYNERMRLQYARCLKSGETDMVTGEQTYNLCSYERSCHGHCGPGGMNFQPHEDNELAN